MSAAGAPGSMAGRTVLITGGTGGIGKAAAIGLAALGARVAIPGTKSSIANSEVNCVVTRHLPSSSGCQACYPDPAPSLLPPWKPSRWSCS